MYVSFRITAPEELTDKYVPFPPCPYCKASLEKTAPGMQVMAGTGVDCICGCTYRAGE